MCFSVCIFHTMLSKDLNTAAIRFGDAFHQLFQLTIDNKYFAVLVILVQGKQMLFDLKSGLVNFRLWTVRCEAEGYD
ncbi:hypothetical protein [Paenibacillus ferrarius]|uniref:hypothetical protein n=1 Tax=Paenibacillus ferrarius TaxID=1469647 RepID=UPI00117FF082|nr:hypothetical protein [Paenibacillus ferrarius]